MGPVLRDRYETLELIGRGGQGQVVRAFDRVHERMVAVKIRACGSDEDRAAVLGEAGVLLGVRPHPLLPLVREDFFDGDRYCIVMDWVEGTNLQHRLEAEGEPGLPLDEVVEALSQVAAALDHLHGHDEPVVHGDVKPANVVRTAVGRAVLVDFGVARRGGGGGGGGGGDRLYATSGYQAPETANGEAPTPAADVFALAATAFALLTGQPPQPGAHPRWGAIAGERAKTVEQTLRLGLAFDPARRPPTASALVEGLRGRLAVTTNLPLEPTAFVGRADELATGRSLLAGTRLLTVVGTGGVGKSHLSRHLAAELAGDHPDGVFLVELAPLVDPSLVAETVRGALGVGADPARIPSDLLVDHLASRRLLLVLDNCEHLAGACAELAGALLRSCAHVKVVATSREPLRVPGETVWRLPPMSLPDAVRLLLVRSTAANPALSPGEREQAAVERICRQLDGIPLALELAAARTTTLSFDELDQCLDDHLSLLTTGARTALPRQRTLRATIDWTHEALPDEEKVLFRQLSVFAGGFTLDAVGAVVAGGDVGRPMLADLLGRLVDKSLVVADGLVEADRWARSTRYRLLETLRQYGAERLEASPEGASIRARHLDWARSLAQRGDAGLGGPEQAYWLEVLEAEHDNFRAALAWKPDLALAAALGRLWERRGHWAEGRSLLRLALEADGDAAAPAIRVRALQGAGALAQRQGDYAAARQLLDESLSVARGIDDQSGVAASLLALGNVATSEGRHVEASTLYEQTMSLGRDIGDRAAVAAGAANLGWLAAMRWDEVRAIELLEESLALRRQLEDRHGAATVSTALGHVRRNRGEYALARSLHEESLRIQRDLGDRYGAAWSLTHLGLGLQWQGDTAAAGPLHEEALMIRRQIGDRLGVAWSLLHLADVLQAAGDFDGAARSLADSLAAARSLKDPWCTNKGLTCAGRLARAAGDLDTAAARFAEALSVAVEYGFELAIATCLQEMGGAAAARGAFLRAARLLGAADAKRRSVRGVVHPCDAMRYEGDLAATEAALGPAAFAGAFAEGATLSLDSLARSEATGQLQ